MGIEHKTVQRKENYQKLTVKCLNVLNGDFTQLNTDVGKLSVDGMKIIIENPNYQLYRYCTTLKHWAACSFFTPQRVRVCYGPMGRQNSDAWCQNDVLDVVAALSLGSLEKFN